ncbi:hypothetical protein EVG20_g3852 [Dentipellis fragilis]|uniref:HNH nuclease domain-containing protein n=1 Tax=Dentipellis fragilis TaxID=205917 RepID=A0A4Y9YZC3_9AGAM|nr:hypothetical protein EVG20_g3852 [Dentipellis fragilis]
MDLHATFREHCWTLVPEVRTLKDIISKLLRCKSVGINRPWYHIFPPASSPCKLELIAFTLNVPIIRSDILLGNFSRPYMHLPPYRNLPLSPPPGVHPYFVITAAWAAFTANEKTLALKDPEGQPIATYALLKTIMGLWDELALLPMEVAAPPPTATSHPAEGQRTASEREAQPGSTSGTKRKRTEDYDTALASNRLLTAMTHRDEPACLITNDCGPPQALTKVCITEICDPSEDLGEAWGLLNAADHEMDENTITLRKDWHATFADFCWTLVPRKNILQALVISLLEHRKKGVNGQWDAVCRRKRRFHYIFVPFKLGNLTILRDRDPKKRSASGMYSSPYDNFPEIASSTLHPYFVVFSAWAAFRANEDILKLDQVETYALLKTIVDLWHELAKLPWDSTADPEAPAQQAEALAEDTNVSSRDKRAAANDVKVESASKKRRTNDQ